MYEDYKLISKSKIDVKTEILDWNEHVALSSEYLKNSLYFYFYIKS